MALFLFVECVMFFSRQDTWSVFSLAFVVPGKKNKVLQMVCLFFPGRWIVTIDSILFFGV